MSLIFEKNKKKKSASVEERDAIIRKIVNRYKTASGLPDAAEAHAGIMSREYKEYKAEEAEQKQAKGLYEGLVTSFGKIVKLSPDKETKEALDKAIQFAEMHVTSGQVYSATIVLGAFLYLFAFIIMFAASSLFLKMLLLIFPAIIAYHFMTRPYSFAEAVRVRVGSELIVAVLYMIVFMKSTPNIEGAVRFAATNVSGRLSKDMNEILWKVEVGIHSTVEDALSEYAMTWSAYNKEFVESIQLLRESMLEPSHERRDILLDKAIDIVLTGTSEKMQRYSRQLETPVMVLHGVGVLLPVLGMVAFPLVSIFLASEVKGIPFYLFFGYNIFLPVIVYYFILDVLSKRPATHSTIDISVHPDYTPLEIMRLRLGKNNVDIPVFPAALALTVLLVLPGLFFAYNSSLFSSDVIKHGFLSMLASISVVAGLAIGASFYYYCTSFQKIKLRNDIVKTEDEFEDALFSLGNRLSGGTPVEKALVYAQDDTKELGISGLFAISLKNMNRMNMTFEESLFDKTYGALRFYPSALIRAIMKSVSSSVEKGTRAASLAMLTIARYLRDMHATQERIEDLLSSMVSQMQFQAYVLVPAISGVVVAISDLIIQILARLSDTFSKLETNMPGDLGGGMNPMDIFGFKSAMPSELLQLVVGTYVVQILIILGMFMTRIDTGDDRIKENDTIWRVVLTGTFIYLIVLALVSAVFRPLISNIGTMGGAAA